MPSKPRGRPRASKRDSKSRTPSRRSARRSAVRSSVRHRRIEPGSTYLITKKTNDDRFWLIPTVLTNLILLYLLILKANKYGVLVHAFAFLSNHFHLVVTDVEGKLPAFMCELTGESGKALKVARKTSRRVWSGRRYSATHLLDLDAAERKIAYTLLNSLESELTEPEEWPGLTSARIAFGETISARRPDVYFSEKRPESVSLTLAPLSRAFTEAIVPGPDHDPADPASEAPSVEGETMRSECTESASNSGFQPSVGSSEDPSAVRIRELVEAGRDAVHRRLAEGKRELAGAERVLRTPWTRRATHPIGDLNPRFATKNRELLETAIEDMKQFEADHEAAKQRYIAGHHRTLFPSGTYGYRVVLGVRVAKRGRRAA